MDFFIHTSFELASPASLQEALATTALETPANLDPAESSRARSFFFTRRRGATPSTAEHTHKKITLLRVIPTMTFRNSQVRFYVSLIGSGEGRHTTHLLKCVLLLSTSQTDWKQSSDVLSDISCDILSVISSDISFDILFDISSAILSDICFDILSDISSDILSDISFDVLSDILSDISFDVLSDISSDILSDIFSDILSDISFDQLSDKSSAITSDILSDILFWHVF